MEKDTQMGPLNSFKQLENIEKNIKATIEQGGKVKMWWKKIFCFK
jgi:aldehyde dehydrogenase (NAD+)/betaine-aldehyde dehydrogenase